MKREDQILQREKKLEEYCKLLEQGYSYSDIAEQEGVTRSYISSFFHYITDYPNLNRRYQQILSMRQNQKLLDQLLLWAERSHTNYAHNLRIYHTYKPISDYVLSHSATYQEAAERFQLSKSEIQNALDRLKRISPSIAFDLQKVAEHNIHEHDTEFLRESATIFHKRMLKHLYVITEGYFGINETARYCGTSRNQVAYDIHKALESDDMEIVELVTMAREIIQNHSSQYQKVKKKEQK